MPGSRSDIPDFEGSEDEAFPPLPPPGSPGGGDGEDEGLFTGDGDVSKMPDVPVAKRKGVKRPQPKLDSQRLTSERGLPALRTLFDDVRFRGKGHEAQDLKLLMQKMENWAHRLYPKLQFEDFVDKVEKLGSKKEVQTCLKRIRLDMPLLHQDFMDQDGEDPAPAELQEFRDPDPDPDPFSTETDVDAFQRLVHSTPAPPAPLASPVQSTPAPPTLTEQQRRRMELNRQQALARRLKRQQTGPGSSDSQSVQTSPSGHPSTSGSTSGSSTVPNESPIQDDEAPPTGPEEAPPTELEEAPPTELEAPPTELKALPTEPEAPPTSLEETPPTEPEAPPPTGPEEAPPTGPKEAPPTELKAPPTELKALPTSLEETPPTEPEAQPTCPKEAPPTGPEEAPPTGPVEQN